MYGYVGKILRVDLSEGRTWTENLDEATARKWVGGSGLGTKYLLEEVPSGTKWSDPENRLIITLMGWNPLKGRPLAETLTQYDLSELIGTF